MKCQRCGLPILDGPASYAGPQCKCWTFYAPTVPPGTGAPPAQRRPVVPLTEADVRRIIREELARLTAKPDA